MASRFDTIFKISIVLKGLDAAAEIIGGLFFLLISPDQIKGLIHWFTASELRTDPHDFIANLLVHTGHNFSNGSRLFVGIYLLAHGVIKMFAVVNVLRNKYWAYPLLVVVLLGFIIYQVIQITRTHSISLILLTIFDVFIVIMTSLEWRKQHQLRLKSVDRETP
jgi:uncharacterized membrane protein